MAKQEHQHTTHVSTTTKRTSTSQELRCTRQQQRRQRAANQISSKSNRSEMACKGKTSRKATRQEPELVAHQTAVEPETRSRPGRKEKLAWQLARLQRLRGSLLKCLTRSIGIMATHNASADKLSAKADELAKGTRREARQADFGRKNGFKTTASRTAKRTSLFIASL